MITLSSKTLQRCTGVTSSATALLLMVHVAMAAGIEKGPYIQNPTTDGIAVCWVTDTETTGTVRYGEKTTDDGKAQDDKPTRYHKVRISGLKPDTHYRYVVEDGAAKEEGSFVTAPQEGKPFQFAV